MTILAMLWPLRWPRLNLQMCGIEPQTQYWTVAGAPWGQVASSICIRNNPSCSDFSGQSPGLSQGLTVLELYLLTSVFQPRTESASFGVEIQ